jgi:branched-chain amino acid transport system permease protein
VAEVLLELREVRKSFGGVRALQDVSLQVREGEIVGLIGPNGSGKSTLINVATGYYAVDGGEIWFDGVNITRFPPHRRARLGLARTYQHPRPFWQLNAQDNVAMGDLFGRNARERTPESARTAARQWLAVLGLEAVAEEAVSALTLQERRLLELARVLASHPRAILADEVLAGLTVAEAERVMEALRKIRDMGVALLVVEHNIKAIRALADRIVVLHEGRVLTEGLPEQVLQDVRVRQAYLGGSPHHA